MFSSASWSLDDWFYCITSGYVVVVFQTENEDGIWLKLTTESAIKYCSSDMEAWTLAVGLSGRMFLAAEGDDSYQVQAMETKALEASNAASMFPTAASVFGTPQQSVFGSTVTPSTFQFPSSKPIKLKFGSQDGSSTSLAQDLSKPFKFGSTSMEDDKSSEEKAMVADSKQQTKEASGQPLPKGGQASGKTAGVSRNQPPKKQISSMLTSDPSNESSLDLKKEGKDDAEQGTESSSIQSELGKLQDEEESSAAVKSSSSSLGPSPQNVKQALSPAVAECQRAVFAAFLWQESLVHDAMASATYLKFHPELAKELHHNTEKDGVKRYESEESTLSEKDGTAVTPAAAESEGEKNNDVFQAVLPPTLGHLVTLWDEISTKVLDNSSATLTTPKVPALAKELQDQYEAERKELDKRRKDKDKKVVVAGGSTVCELCDQSYLDPVTYHMKSMHPGCGKHANGWGYNSRGSYCSGWAGSCGDGGRGGSTWYLLCQDCHTQYMAVKDDVRKKAVKSVVLPTVKTKKPGRPRSLPVLTAVQGMIINAKFILEIARSSENVPTTPQLKSPSLSELMAPELLRQVSTPLDSTTPSLAGGPLLHSGPSTLTKSDSLPHEPSGAGEAGATMEQKIREQTKRPYYLRSISEAFKPDLQASSEPVQSPDDPKKAFKMPVRAEEPKTPVLDNTSSSSLMVKPSKNLRQLIYKRSRSSPENKDSGYKRVMDFVMCHHDLDGLRVSMKQSMRMAGLRMFAMEVSSLAACVGGISFFVSIGCSFWSGSSTKFTSHL